jgi:hypothetical protein
MTGIWTAPRRGSRTALPRPDHGSWLLVHATRRAGQEIGCPASGWIYQAMSRIAFASALDSWIDAAAMFSATCSGDPEPGIGRI